MDTVNQPFPSHILGPRAVCLLYYLIFCFERVVFFLFFFFEKTKLLITFSSDTYQKSSDLYSSSAFCKPFFIGPVLVYSCMFILELKQFCLGLCLPTNNMGRFTLTPIPGHLSNGEASLSELELEGWPGRASGSGKGPEAVGMCHLFFLSPQAFPPICQAPVPVGFVSPWQDSP